MLFAETKVSPGGSCSVSSVSDAGLGPLLVTVRENTTLLVTGTGFGEVLIVTARSAELLGPQQTGVPCVMSFRDHPPEMLPESPLLSSRT